MKINKTIAVTRKDVKGEPLGVLLSFCDFCTISPAGYATSKVCNKCPVHKEMSVKSERRDPVLTDDVIKRNIEVLPRSVKNSYLPGLLRYVVGEHDDVSEAYRKRKLKAVLELFEEFILTCRPGELTSVTGVAEPFLDHYYEEMDPFCGVEHWVKSDRIVVNSHFLDKKKTTKSEEKERLIETWETLKRKYKL